MKIRAALKAVRPIAKVLAAYARRGSWPYSASRPTIYVDFQDSSAFRRHHVTLAFGLSRLPANIVWRFRPKYVLRGHECGEEFWWRQGYFRFDFTGSCFRRSVVPVVVTDHPEEYISRPGLRLIEVIAIGNERIEDTAETFEWPFMGHPNFLFREALRKSGQCLQRKSQNRCYRVSFAGNCDPYNYLSADLEKDGVMSRVRARDIVKSVFQSDVLTIESWPEKAKLEVPHERRIILSNSFRAGLNFDEYHDLLSESDFFLALPGICSPYTHSLYESLACGCIPILPQSSVVSAGWVHLENCLIFRDEGSLITAVQHALSATQDEICRLRTAAYAVFENSYSAATTARRLLDSKCKRLMFRNM